MRNFIFSAIMMALAVTNPLAQAQTLRVLHQFSGKTDRNGVKDGSSPIGGLLRDAAGNLYGTTPVDGGGGLGVVFKIASRNGKESVLLTFRGSNGEGPLTPLVQDQAGNLFGIADGGPELAGVVYKVSQDGQETLVHAFQAGHNPELPTGGILRDASGNIFGTSLTGGIGPCRTFAGCGTIFRLDAASKVHVLYKFTGGSDGSRPFGPLVQDADGNLYGIAQQGGDLRCTDLSDPEFPELGCGTIFKISKKRELTILHTFTGGADGAGPQPGLVRDAAGNLYGTTLFGGGSKKGTIFRIATDGTYTILHRFAGKDGAFPNGGLIADDTGNLYGTTRSGGDHKLGTVYELTPDGQLSALHLFTGGQDGEVPLSGVIRDAAGHLYGTTPKNLSPKGERGGCVYEITP